MTKQEEIREELAVVLAHIDGRYWNDLTVEEASDYIKKTERVAIKVKKELPEWPKDIAGSRDYKTGWRVGLEVARDKLGFTAVEPLIEEGK